MAGADLLDQYERGEIIMGSDGEYRAQCSATQHTHRTCPCPTLAVAQLQMGVVRAEAYQLKLEPFNEIFSHCIAW